MQSDLDAMTILNEIAAALAPMTGAGNPPPLERLPEAVRAAIAMITDLTENVATSDAALDFATSVWKHEMRSLKTAADAIVDAVSVPESAALVTPRLRAALTAYDTAVAMWQPLDTP